MEPQESKIHVSCCTAVSASYRASSLSLSRAAVRMADISLTEALVVQFYCYLCSLLPSDSGKKRWKWALASICSHEKISGVQKFWCGSNFREFNFRTAVDDRKLNPVENNRLYGIYKWERQLLGVPGDLWMLSSAVFSSGPVTGVL